MSQYDIGGSTSQADVANNGCSAANNFLLVKRTKHSVFIAKYKEYYWGGRVLDSKALEGLEMALEGDTLLPWTMKASLNGREQQFREILVGMRNYVGFGVLTSEDVDAEELEKLYHENGECFQFAVMARNFGEGCRWHVRCKVDKNDSDNHIERCTRAEGCPQTVGDLELAILLAAGWRFYSTGTTQRVLPVRPLAIGGFARGRVASAVTGADPAGKLADMYTNVCSEGCVPTADNVCCALGHELERIEPAELAKYMTYTGAVALAGAQFSYDKWFLQIGARASSDPRLCRPGWVGSKYQMLLHEASLSAEYIEGLRNRSTTRDCDCPNSMPAVCSEHMEKFRGINCVLRVGESGCDWAVSVDSLVGGVRVRLTLLRDVKVCGCRTTHTTGCKIAAECKAQIIHDMSWFGTNLDVLKRAGCLVTRHGICQKRLEAEQWEGEVYLRLKRHGFGHVSKSLFSGSHNLNNVQYKLTALVYALAADEETDDDDYMLVDAMGGDQFDVLAEIRTLTKRQLRHLLSIMHPPACANGIVEQRYMVKIASYAKGTTQSIDPRIANVVGMITPDVIAYVRGGAGKGESMVPGIGPRKEVRVKVAVCGFCTFAETMRVDDDGTLHCKCGNKSLAGGVWPAHEPVEVSAAQLETAVWSEANAPPAPPLPGSLTLRDDGENLSVDDPNTDGSRAGMTKTGRGGWKSLRDALGTEGSDTMRGLTNTLIRDNEHARNETAEYRGRMLALEEENAKLSDTCNKQQRQIADLYAKYEELLEATGSTWQNDLLQRLSDGLPSDFGDLATIEYVEKFSKQAVTGMISEFQNTIDSVLEEAVEMKVMQLKPQLMGARGPAGEKGAAGRDGLLADYRIVTESGALFEEPSLIVDDEHKLLVIKTFTGSAALEKMLANVVTKDELMADKMEMPSAEERMFSPNLNRTSSESSDLSGSRRYQTVSSMLGKHSGKPSWESDLATNDGVGEVSLSADTVMTMIHEYVNAAMDQDNELFCTRLRLHAGLPENVALVGAALVDNDGTVKDGGKFTTAETSGLGINFMTDDDEAIDHSPVREQDSSLIEGAKEMEHVKETLLWFCEEHAAFVEETREQIANLESRIRKKQNIIKLEYKGHDTPAVRWKRNATNDEDETTSVLVVDTVKTIRGNELNRTLRREFSAMQGTRAFTTTIDHDMALAGAVLRNGITPTNFQRLYMMLCEAAKMEQLQLGVWDTMSPNTVGECQQFINQVFGGSMHTLGRAIAAHARRDKRQFSEDWLGLSGQESAVVGESDMSVDEFLLRQ